MLTFFILMMEFSFILMIKDQIPKQAHKVKKHPSQIIEWMKQIIETLIHRRSMSKGSIKEAYFIGYITYYLH